MSHTRFDGIARPHTRNPAPAASARSSVRDYERFLRMLAHDGAVDGHVVLQPGSVAEIERDQVAGLDTSDDAAVQITGIPTYGLGVWRDVVGPDDEIQVVSGSGALGFYPWIDRVHGTYGIVAVDDERNGAGARRPRVAAPGADAVGGRGLKRPLGERGTVVVTRWSTPSRPAGAGCGSNRRTSGSSRSHTHLYCRMFGGNGP